MELVYSIEQNDQNHGEFLIVVYRLTAQLNYYLTILRYSDSQS
jgi:hypothetical protein